MQNKIDRPKNFTLIWYKTGSNFTKMIGRVETKSIRHFRTKLKLLKNQNEYYLRVSYTRGGHNEGVYSTRKGLMLALNAFCEK